MRNFKFLVFPSYVTKLIASGDINYGQLMDVENWGNIFSRATVTKIKQLNSFRDSGDEVLNIIGIEWITPYLTMDEPIPPKFNLLQTLMSDGREPEAKVLLPQLFNFTGSFKHHRANDGTYLILLNDLKPIDSLSNRYVEVRSNMGELIDDMSSLTVHDDFVCEPIVKSYMKKNI